MIELRPRREGAVQRASVLALLFSRREIFCHADVPITYSIDRARGRLTAVAEGNVTFSEIVEHLEKKRADEGLPLPELIEATRAAGSLIPAEVRELVERLRVLGRKSVLGPTAVVVGDDLTYGILRMLEILVEDVCDIRPFRDQWDAEQWLNSVPMPRSPGSE